MDQFRETVDKDAFAKLVGIQLIEVKPGYARAVLPIVPHHLNGLGLVHGAAIFTLADLVFAAASNSHGVDAVAVHIDISYFKAVREGTLIAEAREVSLSRKLGTYSVSIRDETEGEIAAFHGTAYRRSPKN